MKKLMMIGFLLGMMMSAGAQDMVADFLGRQKNTEVFTQVNISSKMFSLIADMTDAETEGIINNLTGMKILTADKEAGDFFREAKQMLDRRTNEYETLMNIKEEGEEVWMYIRESQGGIRELVVLVGNQEGFVLMNFLGKIDLKKISKLAKAVNVDGVQYLDRMQDSTKNKTSK